MRRPSHLVRGFIGGLTVVAFFGLCFFPTLSGVQPSPGTLRAAAAIGGTFFAAWAVQSALIARSSYFRDPLQETLVGSLAGVAAAELLGLITAFGLSERVESGHWTWADQLAFALFVSAFVFLGICMVLLVYFAYEWARQERIDPPE
jgi:hypothetical protein